MRLIIHTYIKEKEKLFLTAVYQILNTEGMTKLEKKKFCNHHSINGFRQKSFMNAQTSR